MEPSPRLPEHPVSPRFVERWSPRSFTDLAIDEPTLFSILEAARWAPSAFNAQPWRFVYLLRGDAGWDALVDTLSGNNQLWAPQAAALLVVLSRRLAVPPGGTDEVPSKTHDFDAGAAWGYLALHAAEMGWSTHGMIGFDQDRVRALLGVPDEYALQAVVAIGRQGERGALPEHLQPREQPSPRRPLADSVARGRFVDGM